MAGEYNGLLTGNSDSFSGRGLLKMNVLATGRFTGTFSLGAARYTTSGQFKGDGTYFAMVKSSVKGQNPVLLALARRANQVLLDRPLVQLLALRAAVLPAAALPTSPMTR